MGKINESTKFFILTLPNSDVLRYSQFQSKLPLEKEAYEQLRTIAELSFADLEPKNSNQEVNKIIIYPSVLNSDSVQGAMSLDV